MRLAVLAAAALLTACVSTPAPADRPSAAAASRDRNRPGGIAYASYAAGRTSHETHPTYGAALQGDRGLDDSTDAGLVRVLFEGGLEEAGGGLQVESSFSDDDLHNNRIAGANGKVTSLEVFPYFVSRPSFGSQFRIAMRGGPDFQTHDVEFEDAGPNELSYCSFGFVGEVEPEVDFYRNKRSALSIYGTLRAGAGFANVNLDLGSRDQDFSTTSATFGLELGLRFQAGKFLAVGGYVLRETHYDLSDPAPIDGQLVVVYDADFDFDGFFVGAGARW